MLVKGYLPPPASVGRMAGAKDLLILFIVSKLPLNLYILLSIPLVSIGSVSVPFFFYGT